MPNDAEALSAEAAAFIRDAAERWINDGSNHDGYCAWCREFTCGIDSAAEYAKPHKPDCGLKSMLAKLEH